MKKIAFVCLCTFLAFTSRAQSWEDALNYSQNEYGGTARSIAMGNAFTAVGGDLGSLGINPAGSAVPGYSTVTLTSGLSISAANATSQQPELGFGDKVQTGYSRFKVPNLGFVLSKDTGRRSGLKRVAVGFVANTTADFTGRMYATGVNSTTSFCGSVASSAAGYPVAALAGTGGYGWWNLDEYKESYHLPWRDVVAYRSGIIGQETGAPDGRYLGLTDWDKDGKNTGILGDLDQRYGLQTRGYKQDFVINFGLNYNDNFYVGFNLGMQMLKYSQAELWRESPADPSTFPSITMEGVSCRFQYQEMRRLFDASGVGVYLKTGVLWRPVQGLRLGAALQTPTLMDLHTRSAWYGNAVLQGFNLPASQSPDWDDYFAIRTPWIFNAGAAYTFGKVALLSVDYEVANYRKCRFRNSPDTRYADFYGNGYFDDVNADIYDVLGFSHSLRAGLELNVSSNFSLRAGYGFITSAQHNFLSWEYDPVTDKDYLMVYPLTPEEMKALCKHQFSLGAGYSRGSFFCDVAFRYKTVPALYVTPYQYMDYDASAGTYAYTDKYVNDNPAYAVPEVVCTYRRFDVMLTLGLRF